MHIAVCDDDRIILDQLSEMLDSYADKSEIPVTYETFESYSPIIDRVDEFDIFLLDYRMDDISRHKDEMNGMEFAKLLREKRPSNHSIIFITAYNEIVYEAFEVRTHRFLTKPINSDKLFEALDGYVSLRFKEGTIIVKANDNAHVIKTGDIYYLEVARKNTFIHTAEKSIKCHRTISSFEAELKPYGFVRVHRSFIVNTDHIKTYNKKQITMCNGTKIFISPHKYDELCAVMLKKPPKPKDLDSEKDKKENEQ